MRSKTSPRNKAVKVVFDAGHPQQKAAAWLAERVRKSEEFAAEVIAFHRARNDAMARQRALCIDELHASLVKQARPFATDGWWRGIKLRYLGHPLCTVGSTRGFGGRFNTGAEIERTLYVPRHALYVATDSATALAENSAVHPQEPGARLSGADLVLSSDSDYAQLEVRLNLDTVLDLRDERSLRPFVEVIKDFSISRELTQTARRLGLAPPQAVRVVGQLVEGILARSWRVVPSLCGIPANGQLLGALAREAGIQAILYPSAITGRDCLAVFPEVLATSASFVELKNPRSGMRGPPRLDQESWRLAELAEGDLP